MTHALSVNQGKGIALPNELMVVFGSHGGAAVMLDLAARLALQGPLYVLDCGNRSDMYRVARTLRFFTHDPVAILRNIRLSRAFTCYQVVALMEKLSPEAGIPVLVLDLQSTFMDENVKVEECNVLFEKVLQRMALISQHAPVVVSAKPIYSISSSRSGLLEKLKAKAFHVWEDFSLLSQPVDTQLSLFAD